MLHVHTQDEDTQVVLTIIPEEVEHLINVPLQAMRPSNIHTARASTRTLHQHDTEKLIQYFQHIAHLETKKNNSTSQQTKPSVISLGAPNESLTSCKQPAHSVAVILSHCFIIVDVMCCSTNCIW